MSGLFGGDLFNLFFEAAKTQQAQQNFNLLNQINRQGAAAGRARDALRVQEQVREENRRQREQDRRNALTNELIKDQLQRRSATEKREFDLGKLVLEQQGRRELEEFKETGRERRQQERFAEERTREQFRLERDEARFRQQQQLRDLDTQIRQIEDELKTERDFGLFEQKQRLLEDLRTQRRIAEAETPEGRAKLESLLTANELRRLQTKKVEAQIQQLKNKLPPGTITDQESFEIFNDFIDRKLRQLKAASPSGQLPREAFEDDAKTRINPAWFLREFNKEKAAAKSISGFNIKEFSQRPVEVARAPTGFRVAESNVIDEASEVTTSIEGIGEIASAAIDEARSTDIFDQQRPVPTARLPDFALLDDGRIIGRDDLNKKALTKAERESDRFTGQLLEFIVNEKKHPDLERFVITRLDDFQFNIFDSFNDISFIEDIRYDSPSIIRRWLPIQKADDLLKQVRQKRANIAGAILRRDEAALKTFEELPLTTKEKAKLLGINTVKRLGADGTRSTKEGAVLLGAGSNILGFLDKLASSIEPKERLTAEESFNIIQSILNFDPDTLTEAERIKGPRLAAIEKEDRLSEIAGTSKTFEAFAKEGIAATPLGLITEPFVAARRAGLEAITGDITTGSTLADIGIEVGLTAGVAAAPKLVKKTATALNTAAQKVLLKTAPVTRGFKDVAAFEAAGFGGRVKPPVGPKLLTGPQALPFNRKTPEQFIEEANQIVKALDDIPGSTTRAVARFNQELTKQGFITPSKVISSKPATLVDVPGKAATVASTTALVRVTQKADVPIKLETGQDFVAAEIVHNNNLGVRGQGIRQGEEVLRQRTALDNAADQALAGVQVEGQFKQFTNDIADDIDKPFMGTGIPLGINVIPIASAAWRKATKFYQQKAAESIAKDNTVKRIKDQLVLEPLQQRASVEQIRQHFNNFARQEFAKPPGVNLPANLSDAEINGRIINLTNSPNNVVPTIENYMAQHWRHMELMKGRLFAYTENALSSVDPDDFDKVFQRILGGVDTGQQHLNDTADLLRAFVTFANPQGQSINDITSRLLNKNANLSTVHDFLSIAFTDGLRERVMLPAVEAMRPLVSFYNNAKFLGKSKQTYAKQYLDGIEKGIVYDLFDIPFTDLTLNTSQYKQFIAANAIGLSFGTAFKNTTQMANDLARAGMQNWLAAAAEVVREPIAAFERAKLGGALRSIDQFLGLQEQRNIQRRLWDNFNEYGLFGLMNMAEFVNRTVSFHTGIRQAIDDFGSNLPIQDYIRYGAEFVTRNHFELSAINSSPFFTSGPAGQLASPLVQFQTKQMGWSAEVIKDVFRNRKWWPLLTYSGILGAAVYSANFLPFDLSFMADFLGPVTGIAPDIEIGDETIVPGSAGSQRDFGSITPTIKLMFNLATGDYDSAEQQSSILIPLGITIDQLMRAGYTFDGELTADEKFSLVGLVTRNLDEVQEDYVKLGNPAVIEEVDRTEWVMRLLRLPTSQKGLDYAASASMYRTRNRLRNDRKLKRQLDVKQKHIDRVERLVQQYEELSRNVEDDRLNRYFKEIRSWPVTYRYEVLPVLVAARRARQ